MEKIKVLIVEDEVLIALPLKMELRRAGYEVLGPIVSGEEAIESAKNENPDVVLMDIRLMGSMDGIEAARQIGTFSSARIIFTTGYQDSDVKERAMVLRPAAYLTKPIVWRQIAQVIHDSDLS